MTTSKKPTIIIADDHTLFRQGLSSLLKAHSNFVNIREAADGSELLQLVKAVEPDVILLDLNMPILNGTEALRIIRSSYPKVRIIVITMHADEALMATLIKEGASGYLLKNADIEEVVTAINTVFSGMNYINKKTADALVNHTRNTVLSDLVIEAGVELTSKEKAILCLVVQQFTSIEIADKIHLSSRSVEAYRKNLMQKLNVKNTAGLVAFALKHKLCNSILQ